MCWTEDIEPPEGTALDELWKQMVCINGLKSQLILEMKDVLALTELLLTSQICC